MMSAQLAPVTKSIKVLTDCLNNLEDQHEYDNKCATGPYSPSAPAPTWSSNAPFIDYADTTPDRMEELIAAHRECHKIWNLYLKVLHLPVNFSTDSVDYTDPKSPFFCFITIYEDLVLLIGEEKECPYGYLISGEFLTYLLSAWTLHSNNTKFAPVLPSFNTSTKVPPQTKPFSHPTPPALSPPCLSPLPPPHPSSPDSWVTISQGQAMSFTKAAAKPKPAVTPLPTGHLTHQQANALTKAKLFDIIKTTHKAQASRSSNKGALVTFLLSLQSQATPIDLISS
jgi:hypothetical protein